MAESMPVDLLRVLHSWCLDRIAGEIQCQFATIAWLKDEYASFVVSYARTLESETSPARFFREMLFRSWHNQFGAEQLDAAGLTQELAVDWSTFETAAEAWANKRFSISPRQSLLGRTWRPSKVTSDLRRATRSRMLELAPQGRGIDVVEERVGELVLRSFYSAGKLDFAYKDVIVSEDGRPLVAGSYLAWLGMPGQTRFSVAAAFESSDIASFVWRERGLLVEMLQRFGGRVPHAFSE